jgi:hypothetical protein
MSEPVVIVHGWSDGSAGFQQLGEYIEANIGGAVTEIDLADWLSLNDEVTYLDLRTAMDRAWNANPALSQAPAVNVVTHSTGALVVREWMTWRYVNDPSTCPIRRLVMLAPANFGSPQAHLGMSFFGRIFKGWATGGQTGAKLLSGLELGSDYTWKLAERDYFAAAPWYGSDRIMASVLVGSDGYPGLKGIVSEYGSDGTVRVSTANLNAAKIEFRFDDSGAPQAPVVTQVPEERQIGFGVLKGLNHGSITGPPSSGSEYEYALKAALTVQPDGYATLKSDLAAITNDTYGQLLGDSPAQGNPYYHRYQNTVVHSSDNLLQSVEHYLVQFHDPGADGEAQDFSPDDASVVFQQAIIFDEHNFRADNSYRCFYLDVDLLQSDEFTQKFASGLCLLIEPQPQCEDGPPVGYTKTQPISLDQTLQEMLFKGNRTLLISVEFERSFVWDRVFKLRKLTDPAPDNPLS